MFSCLSLWLDKEACIPLGNFFRPGGRVKHTGWSALDIVSFEIWGLQTARSTCCFAESGVVRLLVCLRGCGTVNYGRFDLY